MRWGIGEWATAFVLDAVTSPSCSSADCAEHGTVTFAGKGYVTLKAGGLPSTTKAMAIDALGRVIVAGTNGKMVTARFWP
ncbi:MAG: hypothetical protein BGO98_22110 [Myxococcales bacterium 68-20]|nr:hypothetical protein [Myxococcales bacterium]OJY15146.1 MAG: hypothetical protein BGO98_22110 [Myxococcales bacterium 68-20]